MRIRSDSAGILGLFNFRRNQRTAPVSVNNNNTDKSSTLTDGQHSPREEEPKHVTRTFEQLLEAQQFCEAGEILIQGEERLFGETQETESLTDHDEEVEKLSNDYGILKGLVLQALRLSLSAGEVNTEALTSAIKAFIQDENQDKRWQTRGRTPPIWRPGGWMKIHDSTLQSLVEERLDNPSTSPSDLENQSSVQADVLHMGKQLKDDLLFVVEAVKSCYPPEMDICNFYARIYHQALGARLRKIADFGLGHKDCTYLLRWVNEFYPQILQKPQLAGVLDVTTLGKLLPEELLEPLEEQYLSRQQEELWTYMSRVLDEEKLEWSEGKKPKREDGCFTSTVAYDIIQLINGAVTSTEKILGDGQKAQSTTQQLNDFMKSLRTFLNDVMKQNKVNSGPIVKANLHCIQQFTDVLDKKRHLFPDDVRENCLNVLKDMKESAHAYLLKPVHESLRPQYRMLGTSDWLNKPLFEKLLDSAENQMKDLQGSTQPCHQKLIGQLHEEVTAEYVKRLLKGKVKLKDKTQQLAAYKTVRDDADSLHDLFSKMGSKEDWLKEILTTIAEVLKLQDLPAIQMQVVSLGTAYPDLSQKHVSALIKLKTNVSRADRRNIKETLSDVLSETHVDGARPFFSKVQVR